MKMGLNSPRSCSVRRISLNISSETFSVARCQMSMILLWRSPCGDGAVETLALDFEDGLAGAFDDVLLLRRDDHVVDADGDAGLGGVEEAEVLEIVEHLHGQGVAEVDEREVHQLLQAALLEQAVDERDLIGHVHLEDDAADGGLDELLVERPESRRASNPDR